MWHTAPSRDWSEGKAFAWLICPNATAESGTPDQALGASVSGTANQNGVTHSATGFSISGTYKL
jgi:hypothetical protein